MNIFALTLECLSNKETFCERETQETPRELFRNRMKEGNGLDSLVKKLCSKNKNQPTR